MKYKIDPIYLDIALTFQPIDHLPVLLRGTPRTYLFIKLFELVYIHLHGLLTLPGGPVKIVGIPLGRCHY